MGWGQLSNRSSIVRSSTHPTAVWYLIHLPCSLADFWPKFPPPKPVDANIRLHQKLKGVVAQGVLLLAAKFQPIPAITSKSTEEAEKELAPQLRGKNLIWLPVGSGITTVEVAEAVSGYL